MCRHKRNRFMLFMCYRYKQVLNTSRTEIDQHLIPKHRRNLSNQQHTTQLQFPGSSSQGTLNPQSMT